MPSLWDYIIPKQQPSAPPRLNESVPEAMVRGFGEGAESGARNILGMASSLIPGHDYVQGIVDDPTEGPTNPWNIGSELGGPFADAGKIGVGAAAGWIPPKYLKGLADSVYRRVEKNFPFVGQEYALDLIKKYPSSSAHMSNVKGTEILDIMRNPDLAAGNAAHVSANRSQFLRNALKEDPVHHRNIEEIIDTPDFTKLPEEVLDYWDNTRNFDKIFVHPRLANKTPEGIRYGIGEEFGHLAQSTMNRFDDDWFKLPYDVRPDEIGAKVTSKMQMRPVPTNYNNELLDHLNEVIKTTPATAQEWDTALAVLNERLKHADKKILPLRNRLGGYEGFIMDSPGRSGRRERIKDIPRVIATLRGVKP